ncbi:Uncharacterised protein [Vibrio cholerae]|uniref:Uncharacterized protein n=1 Tax=Vibrio cholerae TaxID=666 RepID=A0A655NY89_VIBCL|nr:Uncharacterised protein [Vibrio cholerae]CSA62115.1 Uncharacterised protein [Vibrio cholerae]CSC83970.1 Uncharacterised protein [Vibrio cholerae]CSI29717.1 Uncharacterised protein [Vibrio cholerae]CSI72655.1 Uncharacterised protein [Vibrio cholerae]
MPIPITGDQTRLRVIDETQRVSAFHLFHFFAIQDELFTQCPDLVFTIHGDRVRKIVMNNRIQAFT